MVRSTTQMSREPDGEVPPGPLRDGSRAGAASRTATAPTNDGTRSRSPGWWRPSAPRLAAAARHRGFGAGHGPHRDAWHAGGSLGSPACRYLGGNCHGESRGHRDRRRAPVRPVPAPTRHVRRRRRTPSRCQGAVGTKPPSAWNVSDGLILCSSRRSPPRGMMPRRSGGGGGPRANM